MDTPRRLRGLPFVAFVAGVALASATGGAVAGGMITGKQIKNGTITAADIKNGTVQSDDLAAGAATGSPGPAGPQGPAGPPGPATRAPVQPVAAAGATGSCTTPPVATLAFCQALATDSEGPSPQRWQNADPARPATVQLDSLGYVHLAGVVRTSRFGRFVDPTPIFVLPPGQRPAAPVRAVVPWVPSGSDPAELPQLEVRPDGWVILSTPNPTDYNSALSLDLDGVTFFAG